MQHTNKNSKLQVKKGGVRVKNFDALFMENNSIGDTYVNRLTAIKLYLQFYPILLLQVLTNYGRLYPR